MLPHVETIFCDDIRHEVAGKITYVGTYAGDLVVPQFPVALPKLCLAIKVLIPVLLKFKTLTVRVFFDDELAYESTSPGFSDEEYDSFDVGESQNKIAQIFSLLNMAPFNCAKEQIIRVRALVDDEEYRGQALRVRELKDGEVIPGLISIEQKQAAPAA